ncbi:MAG: hypothetical protein WBL25_07780 [Anaerolineales bacterium]
MNSDLSISFSPISVIKKGDPLIRYLSKREVQPLMVIFIGIGYGVLYAIALPIFYGTINQVFNDWPELIRILAITPLLIGYYVWQPKTIQNLFNMVPQRILDPSAQDLDRISGITKPLSYRFWFWIAIIFGTFNSVVYYVSLLERKINWQTSNSIIAIMSTVATFFSFYAVMHIVIRQIITIRGINKFFRTIDIEIAPLHPDKAGGLKPLGQYVVTIGLGIGIIGLALGISLLRSHMGLEKLEDIFYINLGVYLLVAPIFFFIPLIEAHRVMQKAKDNILVDIARQYESLYLSTIQKMKNGDPLEKDLAQMDAIRKMYLIADGSPVWPFNINILSKFSAAVILPVILPVTIDYFTGLIINLLSFI